LFNLFSIVLEWIYFLIALLHSIMTSTKERQGQLKTNVMAISVRWYSRWKNRQNICL